MPHDDPVIRALCRGLPPWGQVEVIASRQGRAIHTAQLHDCGVSAQAIKTAQSRRQLHRVHRGVRAVGIRKLSQHGRRWAAFLAAGDDTAFSGRTGAAMSGIRPWSGAIHLVAPARRRPHAGVVIQRAPDLSSSWIRRKDGLPVLKPAHLLLDLAVTLPSAELAVAMNHALSLPVVTLRELEAVIELRPQHRGRGRLAAAIADVHDDPGEGRTHSELEDLVFTLLRGVPNLPAFARNQEVRLAGGRVAKADVLFRAAGVMLELDSRRWHQQRAAMDSDRRRDQQALAVGLITFRCSYVKKLMGRESKRSWSGGL